MREVLFIGGFYDGKKVKVEQLHDKIIVPVPLTTKVSGLDKNVPLWVEVREDVYQLQRLKGKDKTFFYYQYTALTVDEAISRLFEGYNNTETVQSEKVGYLPPVPFC